MSKVTITIDDTNPALVAAFGANSLELIADEIGYMEMVAKAEKELPLKIPYTAEDGTEYMDYPEGTEMYKINPQSKAEFVARKILEDNIIPRLLSGFSSRKRNEKLEEAKNEVQQAELLLNSVSVIEVS